MNHNMFQQYHFCKLLLLSLFYEINILEVRTTFNMPYARLYSWLTDFFSTSPKVELTRRVTEKISVSHPVFGPIKVIYDRDT